MTRRRNSRNRPQRRAPNTSLREGVYDAALDGSGIDDDEFMYRSLTSGGRGNNLPQYKHEKMLSIARYIGRTNPVGSRILTIHSDFVLGEGVSYSCQNDTVKDTIDTHWRNPDNDWERNNAPRFRRFIRDGCYLMPLFPNTVDGNMTIGSVPADWIERVDTDPENWERVTTVTMKRRTGETDGKVYTIVNRRADASELAGVTNPALYWTFGNDDGHRGISLLYAIADFIDLLDQMMFSEVERWMLIKAFMWDVTIEGTPEDIAKYKKQPEYAQPPRPGSVLLHNPQVTWEPKTPSLDTADAVEGMRFLRNHVFGALGIPEMWYAEGGDVNRAVGTVMAEVPRKRLTALQDEWRFIMHDVVQCQLDYAVLYGSLSADVAVQDSEGKNTAETMPAREAFDLRMPDLSGDDVAKLMPAIQQLTATLILAEGEHYVTKATARTAFLTFFGQIGVDINIDEEAARAETEVQDAQAQAEQIAHTAQPPTPLAVLAPRGQRAGDVQPVPPQLQQAGG